MKERKPLKAVRSVEDRNALAVANHALVYWALGRLPREVKVLGFELAEHLATLALLRACDLWESRRGRLSTIVFLSIRRKLWHEMTRVGRIKAARVLPFGSLADLALLRESGAGRYDPDHAGEAEALLRRVPPRERLVLRLRILEERTLEEIGGRMGLGKERVRQLQQSGLARLRLACDVARPGDLKRLVRHKTRQGGKPRRRKAR